MTQETLGSLELNRIYQMDCIEGMRLLPDDSVDLMRKAFGVRNRLGEQLRCRL